MAGRGRGGRGGKGRGMSFNVEQLGFQKGEALPGPVLQPPPVYPPLENKPVPISSGVEMEYLVAIKKEFQDFMKDSPYYIQHTAQKTDIERYSDKYQALSNGNKSNALVFDWSRLPKELNFHVRTARKRKIASKAKVSSTALKKKRDAGPVDVSKKLEELEKSEVLGSDVEEGEGGEEEKEEGEEGKEAEEVEEEEEEVDEEMDEGTDYVNAYFDNGENYNDDEDDNLDDGPVY